ncbi:MAG: hypothetical protein ACTHZX_04005 [Microbacterium sp.]
MVAGERGSAAGRVYRPTRDDVLDRAPAERRPDLADRHRLALFAEGEQMLARCEEIIAEPSLFARSVGRDGELA